MEQGPASRYHSRVPASTRVALLALIMPAAAAAQSSWRTERPLEARQTGTFADKRIGESSGVAPSRRTPGVLWTHDDSGEPPWMFATDTSGAARGTFVVAGARNVDWEDIALGPCGRSTCLYIADTGDNSERRRAVKLYRVPEPEMPEGHPKKLRSTAPAQAVTFRYPDGPHDVEAIWVAPDEDVHLITKGRPGRVRHYRVPPASWTSQRPVTAELLETLPIPVRSRRDYVTGAALSPDGRTVVVRSYSTAYFFLALPTGRLALAPEPRACDVRELGLQGEGVGWLDPDLLVLTSERTILPAGTIAVARCSRPGPA
jgi:hypothetical protein